MANKIDILIKAKDEASKEIDGVTGSIEDLGGKTEELKETGSKSFGDFQDNVAIAMLGINQAIEVGMKIADAAKAVYEGTVGKALTVATEIETLSRISGEAPEKMSALRQAAEEAKVPFEDLYKAMENLNKNGVSPTIDNLVAIASEYVKLEDPIAKAELLTKNFGAAGDEIAPMLEAIAGGVKDVQNAGMVFSEADLQAAKEHEQAVADLSAAWDGFVVTIGKKVMPVLTDLFNQISDSSNISYLRQQLNDVAGALVDAKKITEEQYNTIMAQAYDRTMTTGEAINRLEYHLGRLKGIQGDTTTSTEGLTGAQQEAAATALAEAEAEIAAAEAAAHAAAEQENLNTTITGAVLTLGQKYTPILKEIAEKQERIAALDKIQKEGGGYLDGVWVSAEQAAEEMGKLTTEILNAKVAMQGLAAQAVAGIAWGQITADGKVTLEEITRYYDYLVQAGIMTADAGKQAIQDFMDYWDLWDPEAKTLPVEVALDTTEVDQWDAPAKYALVHYRPAGDYIPEAAGGAVQAAATGVAASLPHYWVGERGPEPFFPSQDGRIISNTQAMSALRGGAGTSAKDIANAVKQGVKEAMQDTGGGKVFNLTMPTSSNPADIKMAFELMEAWA